MNATIFGGAKNDTTTSEYKDTVEIGKLLTELGYHIKSGGYHGIMEAASKGATENGGTATGYTCKSFGTIIGNDYLTETIVSDDIFDRLRHLINNTDLFIVQKGGLGTLAELFLVLDILRKRKEKPRVILVGIFWFDIFSSIRELLTPKELDLITLVSGCDELKSLVTSNPLFLNVRTN